MKTEPLILSLGGSLLAPKEAFGRSRHIAVLRAYIRWLQRLSKTRLVIVVVGGGQPARAWMDVAKRVDGHIAGTNLDWIGIEASRLNARVLRVLCGRAVVASDMITDPRVKLPYRRGLVLAAGWKPGRSTDYDAVMLAVQNGATTLYNLSNVSGVYDTDPKKYPQAKMVKTVTWCELRSIIGQPWTPGLNVPFDPIAAELAARRGLMVKILNGWSIINVKKAIAGKAFVGTTVQPSATYPQPT